MGEYAKRIRDNEEIKIGTCENMYYIRYEDRHKVEAISHSLDPRVIKNLRWRVPLFSEDGIEPGEYDNYDILDSNDRRHELRLNKTNGEFFSCLADNTGQCQASVPELGLLITLKCYHGLQLNEGNDDVKFRFNTTKFPLHISALKNADKELKICISCCCCKQMWSYSFDDIVGMIASEKLKLRLLTQCVQYWEEHNDEPCLYEVAKNNSQDDYVKLCKHDGFWRTEVNGVIQDSDIQEIGTFDDAVKAYQRLSEL